eukprot:scaffold22581_cov123-Cylindrotheca_fusiformis.AAC.6
MLGRAANSLCSQSGKRLLRHAQSQRRNMAGGGAWLETNPLGERIGEVFGTIAWLWIFHRFRQDGAVVLGYAHPWDHGHGDHHGHTVKKLKPEEKLAMWDKFGERSTNPGEDDDDEEDEDDDDDEDDE